MSWVPAKAFLFSLVLLIIVPTALPGAEGVQPISYVNSLEAYPAGYAITNDAGWFISREIDVALVTNMSSASSPYFPSETDLRALDVSGTVGLNFERDITEEYVWIDLLIRPTCRENTPVLERPYPQIVTYINSDEHLVIFHTYYDIANPQGEAGGYQKIWVTNTLTKVPSNQWSRLTFAFDYTDTVYMDGYCSISINGGEPFSTPQGYADTVNNFMPDGGPWLMCANLPTPFPLHPRNYVSNITVEGTCQIDMLASSFGPIHEPYTSHGVPHAWIASYYGVVDYEVQELTDLDGDGMQCWEEYWAGTSPEDPASLLRLLGVDSTGKVTWQGGTNIDNYSFKLWRSTNLVEMGWTPYIDVPRSNSAMQEFSDSDAQNHPVVYYRVTTPTNAP